MATDNSKQRQQPQQSEQHRELPLEGDLEPKDDESEKIRGGAIPPSDIRGAYLVPPST